MQLTFEQLKGLFPRETNKASISPMSKLEKAIIPKGISAITLPWSNIRYRPEHVSPFMNVNRTMLGHELTHVKQNIDKGLIGRLLQIARESFIPYMDRPSEREARFEDKTNNLPQNIELPKE